MEAVEAMDKVGTYVLFTVPKENLEDFYDWLIEVAQTERYNELGLDIKDMVTPIVIEN